MMEAVNLLQKFTQIQDFWNPKVVGELNGQQVKLAKLNGEFVWHHHEEEDEAFFVLKGTLRMVFRDRTVTIKEGEMLIVPKGTEHLPIADEEVWVMLFEPAATLNTGNVISERTRQELEKI
jgi:mannose-6-phosphate isomerase-like protein (cupin superfamily)